MANKVQSKCLGCGDIFTVDVRNRGRQKYCPKRACRAAGKAARQRRWLGQTGEPRLLQRPRARGASADVAGGPSGVLALAPAWPRRLRYKTPLCGQVIETPEDLVRRALQDALRCQGPVLIGLIAHLSDSALQDDIASTTRGLLQLGQDILSGQTTSCPTNECCALTGCGKFRRSSAGSINGWCATGTSSIATCRRSRCIWCWSPSPMLKA